MQYTPINFINPEPPAQLAHNHCLLFVQLKIFVADFWYNSN